MFLNTIQPAEGATHASRRVGRGIGSGLGKTGGRGHKGQKSRSGGFHKVGFEAAANAEVRLSELNLIAVNEIDVLVLKQAGLIPATASNVKVIASGEISKAVTLKGVKATKGAKAAIEAAGGKVEE